MAFFKATLSNIQSNPILFSSKVVQLVVPNRTISLLSRVWSGNVNGHPKHSEQQLQDTLKSRFPKATNIQVSDVSGGCGAMYEIFVESIDFKGLSTVKQHQLITDTLKQEIKDMHGLRIHTSTPKLNS